MPLPTLTCPSYELGKRLAPSNLGVLSDFMAGAIAQTMAGTLYNPIDVVRARPAAKPASLAVVNGPCHVGVVRRWPARCTSPFHAIHG